MKSICIPFVLIATLLSLTSCTHSYQAPRIETTDFLHDYFQIKESGEDDDLLSYWKKGINWAGYNKVIVAPIIIKKTPGSELKEMSHAEGYRLAELLEYRLREALKNNFKLVSKPDADTLLMQFTITDTETLTVLLNTFSVIYPSAQVYPALKPILTEDEPYAGKTGIEGKVIDSTTGELLMTSADARAGGKPLVGDLEMWEDFGPAYKYWADHFSYQLCLRQRRGDCQKPVPE
jgi:Protein of unknown function (DUF3313)